MVYSKGLAFHPCLSSLLPLLLFENLSRQTHICVSGSFFSIGWRAPRVRGSFTVHTSRVPWGPGPALCGPFCHLRVPGLLVALC